MMKIKSKYRFFLLLSLLLSSQFVLAGQSESTEKQSVELPPLGKLVWSDLYSSNVDTSIAFYNKVFGWTAQKFDKHNTRYHLFYDGDEPIAGLLSRKTQRNKTEEALWIGSFTTNNIKNVVKNAEEQKATILFKPHDFDLYGTRAVLADPQGGVVALLELVPTNAQHKIISHKWQWAQLFSINTSKAADFYRQSFNFEVDDIDNNKNSYYLSQQGEVRASIVKLPASFEQRDRWVNFMKVDDLSTLLKKVHENGGDVIYETTEGDPLAIISDPNGALLGLTEREREQ